MAMPDARPGIPGGYNLQDTNQNTKTGKAIVEKRNFNPIPSGKISGDSGTKSPIEPLTGSKGPLSKLDETPFGYKELRYPSTIGGAFSDPGVRYPYYMKFYVNVAEKSRYTQSPGFGQPDESTIRSVSADLKPNFLSEKFRRVTYRSQQAIILYMPDTLNWSFGQNWKEYNMTEEWGKAGMLGEAVKQAGAWAGSVLTAFGGDFEKARKENRQSKEMFKGLGAETLAKIVDKDPNLGLALVGMAQNPNIEVLYQQPQLRTFQFEFVFAPRDADEALNAISIIQLFKFHAAPENAASGESGRYYIPPSDFDIEFHGPNGELWQFGKIVPKCVLRNITVNYGQSGQFAVLPGDYPTNIQLMLEFQETQFITKGLVDDGY